MSRAARGGSTVARDRSVDEDTAGEAAGDTRQTARDRTGLYDSIGLLARLVLGAVLLVAGALKIGDTTEFARSIQAYQVSAITWDIAQIFAMLVPLVEILTGILLIIGLFTRSSAGIGVLLMLVFITMIISVWVRGISIDCGCFSKGGADDAAFKKYPWEIARDVGLALCGAWLLWRPRSLYSLDRRFYG